MYLLLLGVIGVGAGLLLVYYSIKDNKTKSENIDGKSDDKGKVIYLFDEEEDEKPQSEKATEKSTDKTESDKKQETEKDD